MAGVIKYERFFCRSSTRPGAKPLSRFIEPGIALFYWFGSKTNGKKHSLSCKARARFLRQAGSLLFNRTDQLDGNEFAGTAAGQTNSEGLQVHQGDRHWSLFDSNRRGEITRCL